MALNHFKVFKLSQINRNKVRSFGSFSALLYMCNELADTGNPHLVMWVWMKILTYLWPEIHSVHHPIQSLVMVPVGCIKNKALWSIRLTPPPYDLDSSSIANRRFLHIQSSPSDFSNKGQALRQWKCSKKEKYIRFMHKVTTRCHRLFFQLFYPCQCHL